MFKRNCIVKLSQQEEQKYNYLSGFFFNLIWNLCVFKNISLLRLVIAITVVIFDKKIYLFQLF